MREWCNSERIMVERDAEAALKWIRHMERISEERLTKREGKGMGRIGRPNWK